MTTAYTAGERLTLTIIGAIGLVGLNGVFLYALFARPDLIGAALANPVSLAFIIEALILMVLLAYLFARWHVARAPAVWFIALALLGGLVFAVPAILLWGPGTVSDGDA